MFGNFNVNTIGKRLLVWSMLIFALIDMPIKDIRAERERDTFVDLKLLELGIHVDGHHSGQGLKVWSGTSFPSWQDGTGRGGRIREGNAKLLAAMPFLLALPNVKSLNLTGAAVDDFAPVAQLRTLRYLSLESTPVTDLSFIAKLADLEEAWLDNTSVVDLYPLSSLRRIVMLSLDNTRVRSLEPLKEMLELERLWIANTEVTDLSAVAGLPRLKDIWLLGTRIPTAELDRFHKLRYQNGLPVVTTRGIQYRQH